MEIRQLDRAHQADIRLKNEPFQLWGRLLPSYDGGVWRYTTARLPEARTECYPDEGYDFDKMCEYSFFLGAYDGEVCVGLAVLQRGMFRYLHLTDLKVSAAWRRSGVGGMLIRRAAELARELGCRGLQTEAQDDNLSACLFYLHCGFRIGGLDTEVYNGTSQAGRADVLFYLDV